MFHLQRCDYSHAFSCHTRACLLPFSAGAASAAFARNAPSGEYLTSSMSVGRSFATKTGARVSSS